MSSGLLLSQHSSNPLDVGPDDPRNRTYLGKYNREKRKNRNGPRDSSEPGPQLRSYHTHIDHLIHQRTSILPGFSGVRSGMHRHNAYVVEEDEDEAMESEDELAEYSVPEDEHVQVVAVEEHGHYADQEEDDNDDHHEHDDEDESEHEQDELEHQHHDSDAEMIDADVDLDEDDQEEEQEQEEDDGCDTYTSSPDEELTLLSKPPDEQSEIHAEIADLLSSVPQLTPDYHLVDRLGTGTFSSVYKALDLGYHDKWDNSPWEGHHPPSSSAYYQSRPHAKGSKVFVAIKRIYVTSSPERIRNELAIMAECRGCRHVSQLITAYRSEDQVVVIMPYHRNDDFREFYRTLSPPGIKAYLRCMFRALRDVHARGIIHRDVKPANFLFDPRTGIGTLCDFGLASRMERGPKTGSCLHTGPTTQCPHGRNKLRRDYSEEDVKRAQLAARDKCKLPSEKVGYPENDTRPVSKANRAGTRGFRAPEVLLKCGDQSGAIDVWAVGIILLFFLTGKFPLFQSNDDIEALMEIAAIFGKKRMERTATLHGRTFATNVPSITDKGMEWRDFIERQNLSLYIPHEPDLKFYPYNTPAYRTQLAAYPPAPLPPASSSPQSKSSGSTRDAFSPEVQASGTGEREKGRAYGLAPTEEAHRADVESALNLLERLLEPESTKRLTPKEALDHPFLRESAVPSASRPPSRRRAASTLNDDVDLDSDSDTPTSALSPQPPIPERDEEPDDDEHVPHLFGTGVCGARHFVDDVTEQPCVRVAVPCTCGLCEQHEEVRVLLPGEGIAIGRMPCEFHRGEFGY